MNQTGFGKWRKMKKLEKIKDILKELKKVIIAYSGGTDSTLLLKLAVDTLGKENVLAVTGVSLIYPEEERRLSEKITKDLGVRHIFIQTDELKNKKFIDNPPDRCFYCKKELFSKLKDIAKKYGFKNIIDGTNKDDEKDFRPGEKAKKIFNVYSPLKEAGIGKEEIRRLSKKMNLPTWNKPQMACLASRIPYGEKITEEKLKRIEEGEKFLKNLGFVNVRLRDYDRLARIEVEKERIKELFENRGKVIKKLKSLGYTYITVDLEGFRSGSMNEVLLK